MARANNNGWDFIKEGKTYQYKEDWFIGNVKILKDNSTDEEYSFDCLFVSGCVSQKDLGTALKFTVIADKSNKGYWNGMPQFYEKKEYIYPQEYYYK